MDWERCEAHSRGYTSTLTVTSFMPRPIPKKFSHAPALDALAAGFSPFGPSAKVTRRAPVTRFVTRRLPRFVTVSRDGDPAGRPLSSNSNIRRPPPEQSKVGRQERALLKNS
jgi:hypothetical protein